VTVACIPCEQRHLAAVERVDDSPDTRRNVLGVPGADEMLSTYARAIVDGDNVLGVIGVFPLWEGRGYAWAMLSELAFSHGLSVTKATKAALEYAETDLGFKRIEAAVEIGYGRGHRWIESLGFQFEGNMRNFGPGGVGEYALYARCR